MQLTTEGHPQPWRFVLFTGLSAFPLTPIPGNGSVDEKAFVARSSTRTWW
ncbi:hypothetical protein [Streptomyces sp. ME01-18h]|nr:hypothetical protein [Streptomyces sp. ME01-18h]MDX3403338.1 hypothetical protein [Streptomyces sp. ME01-18h]